MYSIQFQFYLYTGLVAYSIAKLSRSRCNAASSTWTLCIDGLTTAIKEHTTEVIKVQVSFQALEKPLFPGNRLKNCGASWGG